MSAIQRDTSRVQRPARPALEPADVMQDRPDQQRRERRKKARRRSTARSIAGSAVKGALVAVIVAISAACVHFQLSAAMEGHALAASVTVNFLLALALANPPAPTAAKGRGAR